MGCFGSGSQPTYNPPAPPKLPTAEELYSAGTNYAKTNMPMAYGAREGALGDLQDPTSYYSKFQPTSFEQALGDQSFKNIWPDQQAYMSNVLSKSGMAYSPVAATTLGNAYGNLSTSIGQYLNTQANNRANQSLTARLGIDPSSMVNPYVQTGMNQGNSQASLDYGYQQQVAQMQYADALQNYKNQQAMNSLLGQGIGAAGGFLIGGPAGASMGANLGGAITGGQPMNLGGMLQGTQGSNFNSPLSGMFGGGGNNGSAMSVFGGGVNNYSAPNSSFLNGTMSFS